MSFFVLLQFVGIHINMRVIFMCHYYVQHPKRNVSGNIISCAVTYDHLDIVILGPNATLNGCISVTA